MMGLPPIEVEFKLVILEVEVIHIDGEGTWATSSDRIDIWKYHFPNVGFVIFPLPTSMEVDPFANEVGREYAMGWKIFQNVDMN